MDTQTPQPVGYRGWSSADVSGDGNSTNSKRSDGRNAASWNELHEEAKSKVINSFNAAVGNSSQDVATILDAYVGDASRPAQALYNDYE